MRTVLSITHNRQEVTVNATVLENSSAKSWFSSVKSTSYLPDSRSISPLYSSALPNTKKLLLRSPLPSLTTMASSYSPQQRKNDLEKGAKATDKGQDPMIALAIDTAASNGGSQDDLSRLKIPIPKPYGIPADYAPVVVSQLAAGSVLGPKPYGISDDEAPPSWTNYTPGSFWIGSPEETVEAAAVEYKDAACQTEVSYPVQRTAITRPRKQKWRHVRDRLPDHPPSPGGNMWIFK